MEDSEKLTSIEDDEERPKKSVKARKSSQILYDYVINERLSWSVGFAVEVYSETDNFWYPGQVIKSRGEKMRKTVEVIYNGRTKIVPVHSQHIRPLMTSLKEILRKSFDNILDEANLLLISHQPKQENIDLDAFISYSQQDALDAVALLDHLLKQRGVKSWLDLHIDSEISVPEMSKGIAKSSVFLIFLTKSYFERVFTVFELETALKLGKLIIVVWEGDDRAGGFTEFKDYINACPDKYKAHLFQHEALRFERRQHLQNAQIELIADRIIFHSADPYRHKTCVCIPCVVL